MCNSHGNNKENIYRMCIYRKWERNHCKKSTKHTSVKTCLWIRKFNIVLMSVLPKSNPWIQYNSYQNPNHKTVWFRHKETHRPMEQNRKPRNKSSHIWSNDFKILSVKVTQSQGNRTVFSTNSVKKTGCPHAKEWSWILT